MHVYIYIYVYTCIHVRENEICISGHEVANLAHLGTAANSQDPEMRRVFGICL